MTAARIMWLVQHVLVLAGGLSLMRWLKLHGAPFGIRWTALAITVTALVASFYLAAVSGRDD